MSWLLENWFGSKESLEHVREEIHEHLHKESYLGFSGLDNPEQSATRVASKELFLTLHGPWDNNLEDAEAELLQFIHDELPPVVRDEVGIIPFFSNVTPQGYLVLTFIRNATKRDVLINKLPLQLVTPDGQVVAKKTFDLMQLGAIGDFSSRPCEFMFHWNEFIHIPEKEVPLTLVCTANVQKKPVLPPDYRVTSGLTLEEYNKYKEMIGENSAVVQGEVDLQVLDVTSAEKGGLKVVVLFRNGLDKNLEFTEVPITIRDKSGEEVARVRYELKSVKVAANTSKLWGFYVPAGSLKKREVIPAECTAHIPSAQPNNQAEATAAKSVNAKAPKGLIQ